jgi:hypothetical protein
MQLFRNNLIHLRVDDDHVDEVGLRLWTATTDGPIAHPQVVYDHGEPWWNDIDRGNASFVHQISLPVLLAESSSSKVGKLEYGNDKFGFTKYLCSYFEGIF